MTRKKGDITDHELRALLHSIRQPTPEPDPVAKEQIIRNAVRRFEAEIARESLGIGMLGPGAVRLWRLLRENLSPAMLLTLVALVSLATLSGMGRLFLEGWQSAPNSVDAPSQRVADRGPESVQDMTLIPTAHLPEPQPQDNMATAISAPSQRVTDSGQESTQDMNLTPTAELPEPQPQDNMAPVMDTPTPASGPPGDREDVRREVSKGSRSVTGAEGRTELSDDLGYWMVAAKLPEPRSEHGVTLLSDGRVLVAGGYNEMPAPHVLGSSATFDPKAETWTVAGDLNVARQGGQLVALPDGDAILIGGEVPGETYQLALQSAERFDAETKTWRETPKMSTARKGMASVRLQDGRVLVIGGANGPPDGNRFLATAEIYNPTNNTWTLTRGQLNVARDQHLAVPLRDGRVLVVGGEGPWYVNTLVTELYDPKTDSFVVVGNTNAPRYEASATLLSDGRVLVAGGWNPQREPTPQPAHASAEIYDPARGTWELTAPLTTGRRDHATFLLPSGHVMVAGGTSGQEVLSSTEVFDPKANTWTVGPDLPTGVFSRSWVPLRLLDGTTLLTGGFAQGLSSGTFIVSDASQQFVSASP